MDDTGRWIDTNCQNNYNFACKNNIDGTWSISSITGTWDIGNVSCPAGTTFLVPSSSKDNFKLQQAKLSSGIANIWLKLTDEGHENIWTEDPNSTWELP